MPNIPIKVTINEYIELAKYYSTTNSKSFVNGIIDSLIIDLKKEVPISLFHIISSLCDTQSTVIILPFALLSINDLDMHIEEKPLEVPVSSMVICDFWLSEILGLFKYLERRVYSNLP